MIVNSTTCASKGHHIITSQEVCRDAATYLTLRFTVPYRHNDSSRPSGCILNPESIYFGFNTDTNDNIACGSVAPDKTYNCICYGGKFEYYDMWKQS